MKTKVLIGLFVAAGAATACAVATGWCLSCIHLWSNSGVGQSQNDFAVRWRLAFDPRCDGPSPQWFL